MRRLDLFCCFMLTFVPELCRHSDLPEDEKAGEVLNISVQQLYVLSKLGKHEEAKGLAADINVEEYVLCHRQILATC